MDQYVKSKRFYNVDHWVREQRMGNDGIVVISSIIYLRKALQMFEDELHQKVVDRHWYQFSYPGENWKLIYLATLRSPTYISMINFVQSI